MLVFCDSTVLATPGFHIKSWTVLFDSTVDNPLRHFELFLQIHTVNNTFTDIFRLTGRPVKVHSTVLAGIPVHTMRLNPIAIPTFYCGFTLIISPNDINHHYKFTLK